MLTKHFLRDYKVSRHKVIRNSFLSINLQSTLKALGGVHKYLASTYDTNPPFKGPNTPIKMLTHQGEFLVRGLHTLKKKTSLSTK